MGSFEDNKGLFYEAKCLEWKSVALKEPLLCRCYCCKLIFKLEKKRCRLNIDRVEIFFLQLTADMRPHQDGKNKCCLNRTFAVQNLVVMNVCLIRE